MILLLLGLALASADRVAACLDVVDIQCAEAAEASLGTDPNSELARAEIKFHRGEFQEALALLERAVPKVEPSEALTRRQTLYQKTALATADFETRVSGDVTVRFRPGMDEVLIDEAFETLQASHDRIGPILGGAPPGGVRMELYPTAQKFIDASSIPDKAVRTTGVIALSKWTRLLVSSPRALGHGYAWKDTIAHEYIHYVVAWRTLDKTPVWLQEGIARSHETLWRTAEPVPLNPVQASLLAEAMAADKLVPLAKMHPSMAFLSSSEEASLAFAQVSTMVSYLRASSGPTAVSRVLDLVREGRDALQAVADVGAGGDKDRFMADWRKWVGDLRLADRNIATAPVILDGGGDEFSSDPVLGNRADLARAVRLGDILFDAGRPDAALVEYRKAESPDEPNSPALSARTAKALLALKRAAEARSLLETSIRDYPEAAETRTALAKLYLGAGDAARALEQYRAGLDIDPFDPEAQGAIADLYSAAGKTRLADRHARYRRLLLSAEPSPPSTSR